MGRGESPLAHFLASEGFTKDIFPDMTVCRVDLLTVTCEPMIGGGGGKIHIIPWYTGWTSTWHVASGSDD